MDELKQKPSDVGLDPCIVLQLGSIHPTRLLELRDNCLEVLISVTGLLLEDRVFAFLRRVRRWNDLALLDWKGMGEEMVQRGVLNQEASMCAVASLKMIFERVELHYTLYQAYSSTTMRLFDPKWMPVHSSAFPELQQVCQEFEQAIRMADRELHTGRALSLQFQRTIALLRKQLYAGVLAGAWWVGLHEMLACMRSCTLRYEHMLHHAFELQGTINWYVAQVEDQPGKENHAGHAA